jgi:hypothetical protein
VVLGHGGPESPGQSTSPMQQPEQATKSGMQRRGKAASFIHSQPSSNVLDAGWSPHLSIGG